MLKVEKRYCNRGRVLVRCITRKAGRVPGYGKQWSADHVYRFEQSCTTSRL
ncbi:hypothetical protein [Vibrio phage 33Fb.4]|nr:hypothetical protein [Vibrio phage 31Fb.4]WAG58464.1 hypothetical protein [Vibrio phage 33Fb.4]